MKLAGTGSRDSVDDATRSLAVVGGGIGGDDGELFNGVDAEVGADNSARATIGVVVDADAVDAVVVLLRARTSDGELRANAAVGTLVADGDGGLGSDGGDARLQVR